MLTWTIERSCHQLVDPSDPARRERVIQAMIHVAETALYTNSPALRNGRTT